MKKGIRTILIAIVMIFLMATISFGEFVCTQNDRCNSLGKRSILGIYHAMRRDQGNWLDSPVLQWNGYAGEAGGASLGYGNIIQNVGSLCFGHKYSASGDGLANIAVVDVDKDTKDSEKLYLAYAIQQSINAGETATNASNKSKIRQWLNTHRSELGIIGQSDANRLEDYKTDEAVQYASGIMQESFSTTSKDGEGALQTIKYDGEYTFIGPYNLVSYYGSFTNATIYNREGGSYSTNLCSIDGENVVSLSDKANYSGDSFYIVVEGEVSSVKEIYIHKQFTAIRARLVAAQQNYSGGQNVGVFYSEQRNEKKDYRLPGVPFSRIKLKKIDADSTRPISNVKFKVYNEEEKKWVKNSDGSAAEYVDTKEEASSYTTDENGEIIIKNLSKKGTYIFYEIENPNFGYKVASEEEPSQVVPIEITAVGENIEQNIENKRLYVKLSGYVWEDILDRAKESKTNDLYDENGTDKRLKNVTVTLRKANGEIIDTRVTNTITNTKEQKEEGAYLFGDYQRDPNAKKILIEDLRGAYIEFEYNGMCYKSVLVNVAIKNGSKSTDDTLRDDFNARYATVIKGNAENSKDGSLTSLSYNREQQPGMSKSILQYGGNYLYGYEGQKYPISGIEGQYLLKANTRDAAPENLLGQAEHTIDSIYKNETEEVPNINLGLKERDMPDISIVQDIDNAEITLNGYTHTYKYAQRFGNLEKDIADFKQKYPEEEIFDVGVNFGNKRNPTSYTRTIYASDVIYDDAKEKGKLGVYITYEIRLANESKVNTTINQLYNYFDKDYDIMSLKECEKDRDGNIINERDITTQDITTNNRVSYDNEMDKTTIAPTNGIQIKQNSVKYLRMTYRLNNNALLAILNQEKTLNSVTEVISYSCYEDDNFSNRYAGIDVDSEPNNENIKDINSYEDDIDQAPSLILDTKENRILRGTVWQEEAIERLTNLDGYDKQRLGNGQYDKNLEKVIKDVQVDLLRINSEDNRSQRIEPEVAKLYSNREGEVGHNATMPTNDKGEYEFVGVIPGQYILRFTYKNNSILCNLDGTPYGKTLEDEEGGVEYYKSTTYRTTVDQNGNTNDEAYKKTLQENNVDFLYWYTDETKENARLSDARDNQNLVNQRTTVEHIDNSTANEISKINQIVSDTSELEISMDCNEDDLLNISEYGKQLRFVFDNIDFGIIRRPKQNLKVGKEVSYVEVVLVNGQVVIQGDPRKEEIKHLKLLPDGNIHVELDDEIIQGATLKIKYEITVDNKDCEMDYNETNYYYFGKPNDKYKNWKIATVTDLFDYPNNGLNFDKENNLDEDGNPIWDYVDLATLEEGRLQTEIKEALKQYNTILHTTKFATMKPGDGAQIEEMLLTKILSNRNNEFSYDNDMEVNTYNGKKIDYTIPGNYNPFESSTSEADDAAVDVAITGPTGANENYIPIIMLGITTAMLLATGIVLIKKKILKK